QTRKPML
ncbi:hypothetical protein D030_1748B, partial [Vibrio parahaemolyticus AQ3810]